MNRGLDTSFLVAAEIIGHPGRDWALAMLSKTLSEGARFSITPQVVTEFLHVVTDPRRFSRPLSMTAAEAAAFKWWNSPVIDPAFPDARAAAIFFGWLHEHRLGRKRLLDTMLAATYWSAGVKTILTTNPSDFEIFKVFELAHPTQPAV